MVFGQKELMVDGRSVSEERLLDDAAAKRSVHQCK